MNNPEVTVSFANKKFLKNPVKWNNRYCVTGGN